MFRAPSAVLASGAPMTDEGSKADDAEKAPTTERSASSPPATESDAATESSPTEATPEGEAAASGEAGEGAEVKGSKRKKKRKKQKAEAEQAEAQLVDAEGRERPLFVLAFPKDPALDKLVRAFELGNYAYVRENARDLAEKTSNPRVRDAAEELAKRIEPDPLIKILLGLSIALLVALTIWAYKTHGV